MSETYLSMYLWMSKRKDLNPLWIWSAEGASKKCWLYKGIDSIY